MGTGGSIQPPADGDLAVSRRTVLKGVGLGVASLFVGDMVLLPGSTAGAITIHPQFVVDVLRPDDFLRLQFRFVNLELDTSDPAHPTLTRSDASQDALIVIDFGPQHVAEQVLWAPNPMFDSGVGDEIPPAPEGVQARVAGSSRLAFVVPSNISAIPFNLDTLLDWHTFTQRVVPVALPGTPAPGGSAAARRLPPGGFAVIGHPPPALRIPGADETAIEVPWWLVLSPSTHAAWAHAFSPVTRNGRTELWHTRLASTDGSAIDEAHPDPVRAVWARDPQFSQFLKKTATPAGLSDQLARPFVPKEGMPFRMAYSPEDRLDAVRNSADFSRSNPILLDGYTPTPFATKRLMLTALGAYVDIDGNWPVNPFKNDLIEWKNRSTLGRDHYVRIVHKGYLLPLGHRAVLVVESERKFLKGTGTPRGAYLTVRTFLVVIQPERTYPAAIGLPNVGRNFPFHKVEVLSRVSPDFTSAPTVGNSYALLPSVGSDPIKLHFRGTDWESNTSTFYAPFVFVSEKDDAPFDPAIMGPINAAYKGLPAVQRSATFGGDKVAFATPNKPGDTSFPVQSLVFGALDAVNSSGVDVYKAADQMRSFPSMDVGNIKLPDVEKLSGGTGLAPGIRYVDEFVHHEFDPVLNKGNAFLKFVDPDLPDNLATQALKFANENAGGFVNPNQALAAITRELGPVAGQLTDIVNNNFNPKEVLKDLTAKLMGGLPLVDIIHEVSDLTGQAEKAINFVTQNLPTEIVISFVWKPDLMSGPDSGPFRNLFAPGPTAAAVLQGEFRQSLTDPKNHSAKFSGEITDFTLNLLGDGDTLFLTIKVTKLGFKSGSGQKTDVVCKIESVQFAGALAFVESLRAILENLGNGFGVRVDGNAVTAKMNIEIPSISVGVLGLSNLAFNAALTVPLTGDPVRIRFGLSTRDNPFMVQVYIFGGGGWLGIALGTDGMESLEIGFEFGGKLALDVGVASGGVEAMAGIYLKIDFAPGGETCTLEGFLKIDGHVSVLGIVSIELSIYLGFQYVHKPPITPGGPDQKIVTGKAKATLKVSVLFFSTSVSFEVEKSFGGNPADPTFVQAISSGQWNDYCNAFAVVG